MTKLTIEIQDYIFDQLEYTIERNEAYCIENKLEETKITPAQLAAHIVERHFTHRAAGGMIAVPLFARDEHGKWVCIANSDMDFVVKRHRKS